MNHSTHRPRLASLQMALLYLFFVFLSKMWVPAFIDTTEGENALMFVNHYIFPRVDQFAGLGLHTTGRWSILIWNLYWPETYWIHVLGHIFLVTIPFVMMQRWLTQAHAPMWSRVILTLLLGMVVARSPDEKFLLIAALLPMVLPDFSRQRTTIGFLVVLAAVALAAHVKGTFVMAGLVSLAFVASMEVLKRRLPVNALALIAFFFGWMMVAGIGWGDTQIFVTQALTGGRSYGELWSQPAPLLLFVVNVVCMSAVALVIVARGLREGAAGWMVAAYWCLLLFLVFKTSAVRHDGLHYIRWILFLVSVGILYGARNWAVIQAPLDRMFKMRAVRIVAPAGLAMGVAAVLGLVLLRPGIRDKIDDKLDHTIAEARHVGDMLLGLAGGEALQDRHLAAVARVRERVAFPPVTEALGMYAGSFFTIPLAHDIYALPLPILTPVEVWSQSSLDLNRSYIEGPAAPPYMLVTSSSTTDNVLLSIVARYTPVWAQDRLLLLRKRDSPVRLARRPVGEATLRWNEVDEIPAVKGDEVTVAEYRFEPTLLAKLLGFVYRPPLVTLEMLAANGEVIRRQTLASDLGPVGEIISPFFSRTVGEISAATRWAEAGEARGAQTHAIRFVTGWKGFHDPIYSQAIAERLFAPTVKVRYIAVGPGDAPKQ